MITADAIRRIEILIGEYEAHMAELAVIRDALLSGEITDHDDCRRVVNRARVWTRIFWRDLRSRSELESALNAQDSDLRKGRN